MTIHSAASRSHEIFTSRKLLRPTADLLFRKMMMENPAALINLLNKILGDKFLPAHANSISAHQKIVSVQFRNTDLPPDIADGKPIRLDILAECNNGMLIDIEMQCADLGPKATAKRAIMYLARMVSSSIESGENYGLIPPSVVIFILENSCFSKWQPGHARFEYTLSNHTHPVPILLDEDLPWIELVELQKIRTSHLPKDEVLKNWIGFLSPQSMEEWEQIAAEDPMFADLKNRVETYSADESLVMRQRAIDEGRLGVAIDLQVGKAEARAEGIAEGETIGTQKAARGMLEAGISRELVCKALKITDAELTTLLATKFSDEPNSPEPANTTTTKSS